ncbi:uncharacterized protein PAC_10654 [Phialocephala subalpina]|uniref:DUF3824 domain-containing protein n=1 Tax=Phialocephala subalpina TaxID=576137 RepID=A0A1L7X6W7_9HELO|nr:uncharacterized protein PAC_10654 [Phialocephala subalpina]
MPEVTRVVRSYRDEYDSDDDGRSVVSRRTKDDGSYRTVQRYRVTPSRVEEVEVDRRSSRLDIAPRAERIEIDRRSERWEPERPRSAIDIRPRSSIVERERYIERDREPVREVRETERYIEREREPAREPERERTRTVVYERDRESEPLRPWERAPARPWESERDVRETDVVRVEKRTERREEPYELERYQRETEYYDRPEPAPQPIIIRQRAPEPQQIIVQEAPQPLPIVLPAPREEVQIVKQEVIREVEAPRPEPRRQEDEYYYRRDVREVRDGGRRDEDFAMERYDSRRDIRPRDSVSGDEYSDEDYVVRKKIVRRVRSRSGSPHHKRHLAEGALAGAGAAALLANHAAKQGTGGEHRGRKVIGGAALGAIGAEVITRARSRFRDREDDSRSRSRSSSRHSHRKIKTAIGLAAAGLAAAAAAKYVSNRKAEKQELGRGRSRTRSLSRRRYSDDDYDDYDDRRARTRSRSVHADPKHRSATIAKAGAATAAVAAVAEHLRNKSRRRSGERSKSKIRTGAEIAGAGLAGAAVAGLYENKKAKEEMREEEAEIRRERRRSRSRSRARSVGAYSDPGVDPELGMVQYGTEPVYTHTPAYQQGYDYDPASVAAGAAYGATRGSRSRSHRRRHSSSSSGERRHSRSRSRVRDIAGAAAGTAAAAIGINQYKKRKEKKEAERERERRRYEEEAPPENYYARNYADEGYSPSPPHASGGSYYPQNNEFPPPPQAPAGFTHHGNQSTPHVNETNIPPYNPANYANQAPPHVDPYGYPPQNHPGDNVSNETTSRQTPYVPPNPDPSPYFPPPPTEPIEEVREREPQTQRRSHSRDPFERAEEGGVIHTPPSTASPSPLNSRSPSPSQPTAKSVSFGPLSPTSLRSLARIHQTAKATGTDTHNHDIHDPSIHPSASSSDAEPSEQNSLVHARAGRTHHRDTSPTSTYDSQDLSRHRRRRRRRNSDPSSNRPNQPSKHRRRQRNASRSPSQSDDSSGEVEVLPDRFDAEGRPLDRYGNAYEPRSKGSGWRANVAWLKGDSRSGFKGGARSFGSDIPRSSMDYDDRRVKDRDGDKQVSRRHRDRDRDDRNERDDEGHEGGGQEMVEKFARDFGDVFEGKKTWRDLLTGFVESAGGLGALTGGGSKESLDSDGGREKGGKRRRRRETDRY